MKSPPASMRHRLLIDGSVQSQLLGRSILYASAALLYFIAIVVMEESLLHEDRSLAVVITSVLDRSIFWAPGLIMLAPLVLFDLLRVTNRFAGPMYSLKREMNRLVVNESLRPLYFRRDDHWVEMAESFNKLREELLELRRHPSAVKKSNDLDSRQDTVPCEKLFDDKDE